MSVRHAAMLEKTLLFKTLRSALESYKFQFNSMKSLFIISGDSGQIPLELWPSWRHEVNVISSVTWRLPSRRIRSAICCHILSSTRNIYLRLPLLTLLDMRPGEGGAIFLSTNRLLVVRRRLPRSVDLLL